MESALNATIEVLSFGVRFALKVSDDMQAASPSVEGVGTPGHHVTNDVDTAHPRSRPHTGSRALMFKLSIVCRVMTDFLSASSAAELI